jgi:hypothetical protein
MRRGFWKDAGEGGAAVVVGAAVSQAVMARSGNSWPVVARNGSIVNGVLAAGGGLLAALAPKSAVAQRIGYGLGSAALSGLAAIGTQVADYHLSAKDAANAQGQQQMVGQVAAQETAAVSAPATPGSEFLPPPNVVTYSPAVDYAAI